MSTKTTFRSSGIPTVTDRGRAIELALRLIMAATHERDAFMDNALAAALHRLAEEASDHAYWLTKLPTDVPAPSDDERVEMGLPRTWERG